ncbi:MAG: YcbK family protein [Methylococcaceae bacterium]|jgi:uncharacterized protein YcbK (DUF882 family)
MSIEKNLILPASKKPSASGLTRRAFLTRSSMAAVGALLLPSASAIGNVLSRERTLSFHNVNTDEELVIRCRPEQDYDRETRQRFSNLLRDHHADEVREMDPGLIDVFFALSALTGTTGTFKVLSGYRSPETNSWLRRFSHGVAEHSMHIEGKAVDIRMDELSTHQIHQAGLALAMGGVGYYPRSDFVHLDTGSIRSW